MFDPGTALSVFIYVVSFLIFSWGFSAIILDIFEKIMDKRIELEQARKSKNEA
jgi:hypothetical protein